MLEAFKASIEREVLEGQTGETPVAPASPPTSGATRTTRAPLPPRSAEVHVERADVDEGVVLPMRLAPFLVLLLLALGASFGLGFVLGGGVVSVQAAGEDGAARAAGTIELDPRVGARPGATEPGAGAQPAEGPPAPATIPGPTAADRAFDDPENRFTVVVFSVNDYDFGRQRIWELHAYLEGQGFAPITPRAVQGLLVLCVGASAGKDDLEGVKADLQALGGPDGGRPFRDAYLNNIDRYR